MASERFLTCIVCPRGCQMRISLDDSGAVLSVEGNFCRRGIGYAQDECTNPKRTVTSTVRCSDGSVVAVKTSTTVPKAMIFEVMKEINGTMAELPVRIGDVIVKDVCGTGADVVATANADKK